MKELLNHPFPPLFDQNSKVLILGTFPSVKSREFGFYYAHPQNRFWKVMAAVLNEEIPKTAEEKSKMLLKHGIALWDTISSCEIKNSSDASIGNATPNDIAALLNCSKIRYIFCNGKKAHDLYKKHIEVMSGIQAIALPSTSPANASCSLERLIEKYSMVLGPFSD